MTTTKRRWTQRLLLVVNLAVANVVAALWVATFLQPGLLGLDLGAFGRALADQRAVVLPLQTAAAWLAFLGAIGLLLWNFSWLVRRRAGGVRSNWIVSETDDGPVRIAREAVESALQKAGESLPEVSRMRVQVSLPGPRRVAVTGQFHCPEGQNHLHASQRLRQMLLQRFGELVHLGDGTRAELELEFQGFFGKPAKNAPEPAPEPEPDEPEPPFRGPQWPIDDEDEVHP